MTIAIAIDGMGGDKAPREVVRGVILAARQLEDLHLYLVGKEKELAAELEAGGWSGSGIEIIPAENVIDMSDSPVEALSKKRGSSIEVATRLVREQKAAAFVSAGNTGACVAAASLILGRLPAVKRAGIAVAFYTRYDPVVVIDVGANIYCKPDHLIQYGVMASLYAQDILGIREPKVGLLNVGEEDEKGHAVAKQTHALFLQTRLNFVGNIEGSEIFGGEVNVVVCDGFVGNIVLKVSEGLAEQLVLLFKGALKEAMVKLPDPQTVGMVLKNTLGTYESKLDYSEYGGAPLLGVNGTVIIGHGRSDAKAICNAIRVAQRMAARQLNARITAELQELSKK